MLTGLCRRLVVANCKSSVVTRSLLGTSSPRFFSSSSSGDDESGKLPEGFTEAELLKFLSDPEREDSPFQRVKVGQTSFNTQTHQRYGDGTPSSSSLSSSSSSPSSADSSFLPEEVINSSQTPEDVRETILNQLASRPLRPGDIYDPLSLLENDGMSMDSVSFRTQRRGTRPSRLVVTGKELHFTNVWLLSRFLTPLGRIMPRWKTGLSPKKQRKLAAAVKRARQMGLLPYLHKYEAGILDQAPGEMERNPLAAPLKPEKQSHKQQQKENAAEQKEVSPSQEKLAE